LFVVIVVKGKDIGMAPGAGRNVTGVKATEDFPVLSKVEHSVIPDKDQVPYS
jgi:hypothetical protein